MMNKLVGFMRVLAFSLLAFAALESVAIDKDTTLTGQRASASHNGSSSASYYIEVPAGKRAEVTVKRTGFERENCWGGMQANLGSGSNSLSSDGSTAFGSLYSSQTISISAYVSTVDTYEKVEEGYYYVGGSKIYYPIYTQVEYGYYVVTGYFTISVRYVDLAPDLTVSGLSTTPSSEAPQTVGKSLEFTVKNVGEKASSATTATVYDGDVKIGFAEIEAMAGGSSVSKTVDISGLELGGHTLRVVVASFVGESSTGNNSGSVGLQVFDASIPIMVHFDADGGTGTMPDRKVKYADRIVFPACAFERPGHSFAGWKDASGGAT